MPELNAVLNEVTARVVARSRDSRAAYLARVVERANEPRRRAAGCGNLAHAAAACGADSKQSMLSTEQPAIAIVTSYNDLLSAHQPYEQYPVLLRASVAGAGGVALVAGGVPAMCDGITQGRDGMELSLLSREVVAMATGIALAHDIFDGALLLGVCDKIVPGLVMGALSFGHLPVLLIPAGPMPSGLSNEDKTATRVAHAEGRADRTALLQAESASYHSPGTCTFYGTANSNQVLMEAMGLHLPGASFVPPGTPLREALTRRAGERVVELASSGEGRIADIVDERSVLNGVVALLATGGSTNHTMHLVAMAAAAGIQLTWDDFDALSSVVPLLARIYPNGAADVNDFAQAGGVPFVVRELLSHGLMHPDVTTVVGNGLRPYTLQPVLEGDALRWTPSPIVSGDLNVLRPASDAFSSTGGLCVLRGNLGEAVVKVSAVPPDQRVVQAPAAVFDSQQAVLEAFSRRELDRDVVVVLRGQGPRANGMPELHQLTPSLTVLARRGHKVALVTDGRMSGASGRVLAALHVSPEATVGGPIGKLRDGDVVRVDASAGRLEVLLTEAELCGRVSPPVDDRAWVGTGRELFAVLRDATTAPAQGAVQALA